jgi:porphobilinogen synthase
VADLGIPAVLLFGQPQRKDPVGSEALGESSCVAQAIRHIKRWRPELLVVTDVCLCAYTDHGHCGLVEGGRVLNDPSVEQLARMALAHAQAGADIVAPSDMMDGRVGAIRSSLDDAGFSDVAILSYAAKYASSYYGPFRDAAHSSPQFGDRRTYQMDPANRREALREVLLDVEEGADLVMVKPAMPYLDILRDVSEQVLVPVAAYQVSGEYSQIIAASERGWMDLEAAMMESLTSIRRAGADLIISYFAKRAAGRLQQGLLA